MIIEIILWHTLCKIESAREDYPRGRCMHFLLKRCFYVHRSHLCVADYPKALAKVQKNREISKYFGKKLRKLYVNGQRVFI